MDATNARLVRIEGAARDVLAACARVRGEGEDAQILLEAARDAYLDALEMSNEELARNAMAKSAGKRIPMEVLDGIDDAAHAMEELSQAIECAHVAVLSPDEDPSEYIGGALAVMLAVADDVYELVEKLRKDAEDVAA